MPNLPSLLHKIKEASDSLRELSSKAGHVLLLSRPTADGIASTSILAKVFLQSNIRFTIKYIDPISKFPSLSNFSTKMVIFIGLGEEFIKSLSEDVKVKFEIIDHNYYMDDMDGIIASKFGFKGDVDLSSSTLTYLLAKEIFEGQLQDHHLAIAGSLGEHQDLCQKRNLCGLNEEIVKEAINSEIIELKERPLFPRLYNLPLHESIALSVDPLIQGLSGEPETVKAVLQKAGINLTKDGRWRTYEDLTKEEKELLLDTLEPYILIEGYKPIPLLVTSYMVVKEDEHTPLKECRDFARLLNSTSSEPSLGVAIAMGKRGREVWDASEIMKEWLREIIFSTKSLIYDERRVRLLGNVTILMGEGIVDYKLIDEVSHIASRHPPFSSSIIILRTTHGAEGITTLRKGVAVDDDKNLYELAVEIAKPHNAKVIGHEGYTIISSSLIKQSSIIQELHKVLET